jgi:anti-anti-sigma factor
MNNKPTNTLTLERVGNVLVVSLPSELGSLAESQVAQQFQQAIQQAKAPETQHLLIDLEAAQYFGSQVLEWMVVMWKRTREKKGKIAFCHASPLAREILAVARFDTIWPIYESREDALRSFGPPNS